MMEEKRREDLQFKLYRFRARSVPITTYRQPNFDWKSKNQRFRTRSLPSRSLTSAAYSSSDFALNERKANQHTRSPPLSTYLRPSSCSQSVEELRALRAQRRSVELLSKARGPIGVEVKLREIYSRTSLINAPSRLKKPYLIMRCIINRGYRLGNSLAHLLFFLSLSSSYAVWTFSHPHMDSLCRVLRGSETSCVEYILIREVQQG